MGKLRWDTKLWSVYLRKTEMNKSVIYSYRNTHQLSCLTDWQVESPPRDGILLLVETVSREANNSCNLLYNLVRVAWLVGLWATVSCIWTLTLRKLERTKCPKDGLPWVRGQSWYLGQKQWSSGSFNHYHPH